MVRRYESMFIVDADLDETQIQKILDRYTKVITDGGGSIIYAGRWEQGRRKLAYDIARRREGMYLITQFESDAAVPKELDRLFRISDEVFRHMIVHMDDAVPSLTDQPIPAAPAPVVESAPEPAAEETVEVESAVEEAPDAESEGESLVAEEEVPAAEEVAESVEEPEAEPAPV